MPNATSSRRQSPAWFSTEREFISTTYQAANLGVRSAVLSMIGKMYEFMVELPDFVDGRKAPEFNGSIEGRIGLRAAIFHTSAGAPAAAMLMETLIASGVKEFVMFGYAGSLSKEYRVGDILIPEWGVREEGTSYHYLPGSKSVKASNALVRRLSESLGPSNCRKVGIWTTDAPYRETRTKVLRYAKRGVAAVDMESTALMAVAMLRRVDFAPVVVISDELFGAKWFTDFNGARVRKASKKGGRAVLKAIEYR